VEWSRPEGAENEFCGRLHVSVWGPDAGAFLPEVLDVIRRLPGLPDGETFGQGSRGEPESPDAEPADAEAPPHDDPPAPEGMALRSILALAPESNRETLKRLSRRLALAEVCLSWPTAEFTDEQLLEALREPTGGQGAKRRTNRSTMRNDLDELEKLCHPHSFLLSFGSGRRPRQFAPGGRERLRVVVEQLRLEIRRLTPPTQGA
jgi:hypothetical protein